jgi:hypothetical protein
MTTYGINAGMWYQDVLLRVGRPELTEKALPVSKYDNFVID